MWNSNDALTACLSDYAKDEFILMVASFGIIPNDFISDVEAKLRPDLGMIRHSVDKRVDECTSAPLIFRPISSMKLAFSLSET